MSESELSDAPSTSLPPDREIERTLREKVKKAALGPLEDYTVSKVRNAAEKSLGLPEGFFKGDEDWKPRSKAIIENQVAIESKGVEEKPHSRPKQAQQSSNGPKKSVKRDSPAGEPRPRKKLKVDSDNETSALSSPPSALEDDLEVAPKQNKSAKGKKAVRTKSMGKSKLKPTPETNNSDSENELRDKSDNNDDKADGSESEMSVVLDEEPTKKRNSKSKGDGSSDKKSNQSKSKSKTATEPTPDQEEIKRLQGWLVKCGIRKVWGKELKPFESSKAKIRHLKEMLSDVGMSGRYSNEKAAQIKEARELAADIEAVQEGNERWGKSEDDDEGDEGELRTRGGRRLVRGAKNYDFLSSDGEETD